VFLFSFGVTSMIHETTLFSTHSEKIFSMKASSAPSWSHVLDAVHAKHKAYMDLRTSKAESIKKIFGEHRPTFLNVEYYKDSRSPSVSHTFQINENEPPSEIVALAQAFETKETSREGQVLFIPVTDGSKTHNVILFNKSKLSPLGERYKQFLSSLPEDDPKRVKWKHNIVESFQIREGIRKASENLSKIHAVDLISVPTDHPTPNDIPAVRRELSCSDEAIRERQTLLDNPKTKPWVRGKSKLYKNLCQGISNSLEKSTTLEFDGNRVLMKLEPPSDGRITWYAVLASDSKKYQLLNDIRGMKTTAEFTESLNQRLRNLLALHSSIFVPANELDSFDITIRTVTPAFRDHPAKTKDEKYTDMNCHDLLKTATDCRSTEFDDCQKAKSEGKCANWDCHNGPLSCPIVVETPECKKVRKKTPLCKGIDIAIHKNDLIQNQSGERLLELGEPSNLGSFQNYKQKKYVVIGSEKDPRSFAHKLNQYLTTSKNVNPKLLHSLANFHQEPATKRSDQEQQPVVWDVKKKHKVIEWSNGRGVTEDISYNEMSPKWTHLNLEADDAFVTNTVAVGVFGDKKYVFAQTTDNRVWHVLKKRTISMIMQATGFGAYCFYNLAKTEPERLKEILTESSTGSQDILNQALSYWFLTAESPYWENPPAAKRNFAESLHTNLSKRHKRVDKYGDLTRLTKEVNGAYTLKKVLDRSYWSIFDTGKDIVVTVFKHPHLEIYFLCLHPSDEKVESAESKNHVYVSAVFDDTATRKKFNLFGMSSFKYLFYEFMMNFFKDTSPESVHILQTAFAKAKNKEYFKASLRTAVGSNPTQVPTPSPAPLSTPSPAPVADPSAQPGKVGLVSELKRIATGILFRSAQIPPDPPDSDAKKEHSFFHSGPTL